MPMRPKNASFHSKLFVLLPCRNNCVVKIIIRETVFIKHKPYMVERRIVTFIPSRYLRPRSLHKPKGIILSSHDNHLITLSTR